MQILQKSPLYTHDTPNRTIIVTLNRNTKEIVAFTICGQIKQKSLLYMQSGMMGFTKAIITLRILYGQIRQNSLL